MRSTYMLVLVAATLCAPLTACSDPEGTASDAGPAMDAASAPADAGSSPQDAAILDDAAVVDAHTADAGPPDGDSDGVPDTQDCDPMDMAIGRSAARPCSNPCGDGQEMCADGVWGACDAPVGCLCDTEGATRVAACERCGTRGERCTAGAWTATGSCLGSGSCEAGETAVEMDPTMCLHRERLCASSCEWGDWTYFEGPGECTQGELRCERMGFPVSGYWRQVCTEACEWEFTGERCGV